MMCMAICSGMKCLIWIFRIFCRAFFRKEDILIRTGGDEFVVVFKGNQPGSNWKRKSVNW